MAALDASTDGHDLPQSTVSKKRPRQSSLFDHNLLISDRQKEADESLAEAFYSANIAPNVLDNPFVQRALRKVARVGNVYDPPSRRQVPSLLLLMCAAADVCCCCCCFSLSTSLLQYSLVFVLQIGEGYLTACYDNTKRKMSKLRQEHARRIGTTWLSDGASTHDRVPVLNAVANSGGISEVKEIIDCSGKIKDAKYIADYIVKQIMAEPDPFTTVQVIMDNATRASWPLIEEQCPWVICTPCAPHVGSLECGDFYKQMPWLAEVVTDCIEIRKFIYNHQACLAAFLSYPDVTAVVQPPTTRMAQMALIVFSVIRNEQQVSSTFLTNVAVKEYVQRSRHDKNKDGETLLSRYNRLKARVLDTSWWERANAVVDLMSPVYGYIRLTDSDAPTSSKIYYQNFKVQEEIKEVKFPWMTEDDALATSQLAEQIHLARWNYGYSDIHGAGYLLDPEFQAMHDTIDPEVMDSFLAMVDRTYYPPDEPEDEEDLPAMAAYEAKKQEQLNKRSKAGMQLNTYLRLDGIFGRQVVKDNARTMCSADWWLLYGGGVPELQCVAVRVTGQTGGAGGSERGHKEMNMIKSKLRNRLSIEQVNKLVYCRHNLNQLERVTNLNYQPAMIDWADVDGDEEEEEEEDPWEDAREDAELDFELEVNERVALQQTRRAHIEARAARRIPPRPDAVAPNNAQVPEESGTATCAADAPVTSGGAPASRSGRLLRRPGNLADFQLR